MGLNPGWVFFRIFGGDMWTSSPSPDPISDQNNVISDTLFQTWPQKFISIFRPDFENP